MKKILIVAIIASFFCSCAEDFSFYKVSGHDYRSKDKIGIFHFEFEQDSFVYIYSDTLAFGTKYKQNKKDIHVMWYPGLDTTMHVTSYGDYIEYKGKIFYKE